MIYVGLDDTDTLDTPGTNQLARHLVRQVAADWEGRLIVRHQLLEHPDVPCTRKNGCASILLEQRGSASLEQLTELLRKMIVDWCPRGSDPGLCIAQTVPPAILNWGARCKRELVSQPEAWRLAAENGIYLEGLGGTNDGVIGALAAVGLVTTGDDGRVVYLGSSGRDLYDLGGDLSIDEILACGVAEVRDVHSDQQIMCGTVNVGKRLRPNYRGRCSILYVTQTGDARWEALRPT